ncbi:unnamed protein product [Diamesa hyperborea]
MSFNFGNTTAPSLGATSTPAKPTGFGGSFAFGATSTPTAFGTPAAAAPPAFGAQTTGFGQPSSAPAFGAGIAAPTFNTGFGQTATSVAPSFGGFGATATTAAPAFGSSFAAPTAAATPALGTSFGFNQTATAAPSYNFGQTATTNFGFGAAPAAAPSFGGGFGTSFGSSFAKPATVGFGQGIGGISQGFGQQQQLQQQQQQPVLNPEEIFSQSIFNVSIFGDERDTTLARWNYLQAMLGTGKSFYSQSNAPVEITPQNSLCRFKSMGYNRLPGKDNKMGLVSLKLNKAMAQVKDQQQQIINSLNQIFGNKPNLAITIDSVKSLSDTKSQIIIYVMEKAQNSNETKRFTATEIAAFFNQPMTKNQLGGLGVEEILPMVLPDEDQLKEYLEVTPKGIDPRMWKQAIVDNPDPKRFIPVPLVGFNELKWRITCQENETNTHNNYLAKMEKEISELKQRHSNTAAKILEHRRKFAELSHRILKIIVKQESTRKIGLSLSPEEECIKTKLENMNALVSAPTQFKGKLSELLSQMRMQRNQWASAGTNEYTLDKDSSDEMKNFLTMQQKAMELLIETVNKDMRDLKIIAEGMNRSFGTSVN